MNIKAYIGFGSNLGDVRLNFERATEYLSQHPMIEIIKTSSLFSSEPLTLDGKPQPWYLNTVFEIRTELKLHRLFSVLKNIEMKMGRVRNKKWGARVIDLDILFYGDFIFKDEELRVPHPEIQNRKFVLLPLLDLDENLRHPEFDLSVKELLDCTEDVLEVKRLQA